MIRVNDPDPGSKSGGLIQSPDDDQNVIDLSICQCQLSYRTKFGENLPMTYRMLKIIVKCLIS